MERSTDKHTSTQEFGTNICYLRRIIDYVEECSHVHRLVVIGHHDERNVVIVVLNWSHGPEMKHVTKDWRVVRQESFMDTKKLA